MIFLSLSKLVKCIFLGNFTFHLKFSSLFIVSKLLYFPCHYRFHIFMITSTIFSHLISLVVFCTECSYQGPAIWHDNLNFYFSFLCIFLTLPWSFLLFWHSIVYLRVYVLYSVAIFFISHFILLLIVYMISMCIFNMHLC